MEHLFGKVCHVTGVAATVSASVDEKDIKFFTIVSELCPVLFWYKFVGRTVAYGAAFWRLFTREDKSADGTPPGNIQAGLNEVGLFSFYLRQDHLLPETQGNNLYCSVKSI
jgi:hypothetical protein